LPLDTGDQQEHVERVEIDFAAEQSLLGWQGIVGGKLDVTPKNRANLIENVRIESGIHHARSHLQSRILRTNDAKANVETDHIIFVCKRGSMAILAVEWPGFILLADRFADSFNSLA
jgi:hypothetical protein